MNLWRTEQLTEEERVKVKEHLTEEQLKNANLQSKLYKSDVFYANKNQAAELKQEGESNVHW